MEGLHAACGASSPGLRSPARLPGVLRAAQRVAEGPWPWPPDSRAQARQGLMGPTIPSEAEPAWPRLALCSARSGRWVSLLQRCLVPREPGGQCARPEMEVSCAIPVRESNTGGRAGGQGKRSAAPQATPVRAAPGAAPASAARFPWPRSSRGWRRATYGRRDGASLSGLCLLLEWSLEKGTRCVAVLAKRRASRGLRGSRGNGSRDLSPSLPCLSQKAEPVERWSSSLAKVGLEQPSRGSWPEVQLPEAPGAPPCPPGPTPGRPPPI